MDGRELRLQPFAAVHPEYLPVAPPELLGILAGQRGLAHPAQRRDRLHVALCQRRGRILEELFVDLVERLLPAHKVRVRPEAQVRHPLRFLRRRAAGNFADGREQAFPLRFSGCRR